MADAVSKPNPSSDSDREGDEKGAQGDISESDPELQAEIEYAKLHGLEVNAIPIRQRLKLRKLKSTDPPRQLDGVVQVPRSQKNLRKSRAGKRKGGIPKVERSNKYNENLQEELECIDPQDPNYDSETQGDIQFVESVPEVDVGEFEREVLPMLNDMFRNGDVKDTVVAIGDLNLTGKAQSGLVRFIIGMGMDQLKNSGRELASKLLAELRYQDVVDLPHFVQGISDYFHIDLPDVSIDYVDACDIVGNYIARMAADEALPADFFKKLKEDIGKYARQDLVRNTLAHAESKLSQKNRLDTIWGAGGPTRPVRSLTTAIIRLLQEYLITRDKTEAARCVHELEVPHFSHEVVFQAGTLVINSIQETTAGIMTDLVEHLYANDELTNEMLITGFNRLYEALPDLELDMPAANTMLERWVTILKRRMPSFPQDIVKKLPKKVRKRIVSEVEGGKLKVEDEPLQTSSI